MASKKYVESVEQLCSTIEHISHRLVVMVIIVATLGHEFWSHIEPVVRFILKIWSGHQT